MFLIFRETLILCLGAVIAVVALMTCRLCGNRLELLPGIVVPVCFCLGRLLFVPGCPKHTRGIRRVFYQVVRAFALIMLFLFEISMGLFIDANDIPLAVWAIVCSFGVLYVISICVVESMQTSVATTCTIDGNTYIQHR